MLFKWEHSYRFKFCKIICVNITAHQNIKLSQVFNRLTSLPLYPDLIERARIQLTDICLYGLTYNFANAVTAAMAQWARAVASLAECWVFEFLPRQKLVVKTGSDSSTAKRLAIGVSVTGPWRLPL